MITPILETERILLRPARISDAEAIYNNWASDADVARFVRWNVHGSVDETIAWLTGLEANVSDENSYDWLFVLKETGEPFGSGGVIYNKTHGMFEIGYCIMKRCWDIGLATEAASAILRFVVDRLNQTMLFACHVYENPASGRVLEKLGFVYKSDGACSICDGGRVYKTREYFFERDIHMLGGCIRD